MALRYLAVVTPESVPSKPCQLPSDESLLPKFKSETLSIFANDPVIKLAGNKGAIVGHLFTRTMPARRVTEIDADATTQIIATRGQSLMTGFWGGYVAFVHLDDDVVIMRDPSGALPCYFGKANEGLAFASDINALEATTLPRPQVNWHGLYLHLAGIEFKRTQTALTNISELLAGYSLFARRPDTAVELWSPWRYIGSQNETDAEAADRIKSIVDASVDAWGSCFSSVGISLSGGLDSSVVAAALRTRSENLTLLNLASNDAEGDERQYARLAAEAISAPLTEMFYDPNDVDFSRSTSTYLPRPIYSALAMADIAIKSRVATKNSLEAWMSGLGGDNVFCIMSSPVALLDKLSADGLSPDVFTTFGDVLRLTGRSIPEIFRETWRAKQRYKGKFVWSAETEFLSKRRSKSEPIQFEHPWLSPPSKTPIGKVEHVASLLRIQGSIDGFERSGPPLINPLLSQPIVEACLSIPTWQWSSGGRNRAIARQAYAGTLPARLLNRRSKGGPNGFAFRLMNSNRSMLKSLLVGGLLVENDIIDGAIIANTFAGDGPLSSNVCFHLCFLAEAETWCRHWQE